MGWKLRGCGSLFFGGLRGLGPRLTQCGLGLTSYQVAPWSIQLFRHNTHGLKTGGLCPFLAELGSPIYHNVAWTKAYQVASWSTQPFGHNRHGPVFEPCTGHTGHTGLDKQHATGVSCMDNCCQFSPLQSTGNAVSLYGIISLSRLTADACLLSQGRGILQNMECIKLSRGNLQKFDAHFSAEWRVMCGMKYAECCRNEHLLNTCHKLEAHKSNIIDNMQCKHILLASTAKHSSTSQLWVLLHDVYTTRSSRRSATSSHNCSCLATAVSPTIDFERIKTCLIHAIVRPTVAPITQIEANHIDQQNDVAWQLECGRLKLIEIIKGNYPVLWQMDHKEYGKKGPRDTAMHLLYNTSEHLVILRSAEMRNFSAVECGKVTRGNLRNVPHLIFCKLLLNNFLHSAKYPWSLWQLMGMVRAFY